MKDKKLIILYILMLVIGFALLLTNSSSEKTEEKIVEEPVEQKDVIEMVTVAVAKNDITERTIIKPVNYYFKTIEVNTNQFDKTKYVTNPAQIDSYIAKNNIQQETIIQHSFIASPKSTEYLALSLKPGEYIFPIEIAKEDIYLLNNLRGGDLIDIYILYGFEQNSGRNNEGATLVSPSRNFSSTNIKPIIVGKKVLFIEDDSSTSNNKQNLGRINLVLSNEEIKLVRTLMTNSTVILYPSTFNHSLDEGMFILGDREKGWPLSQQQIFNRTQINKLRGN